MDCGDAGHILVSKHAAEDLEQYDEWQPYLHDLGECEGKHGERLHVVNLFTMTKSATPLFRQNAHIPRFPERRHLLLLRETAAAT